MPKFRNIKLKKIWIAVFGIFLTFGIFYSGYLLGKSGFTLKKESNKIVVSKEVPGGVDFTLFWRVWDTLGVSYFDESKLDTTEMIYGAIKGMVAAVGDPYTVFLPPDENKVVQEDLQGTFEGVGIQIGFKGTNLAVIAPLPDSPAEKAGVKAGDLIVGIKDEVKNIDTGTFGMTLPEAVELIRGKAGSTVTLLLLRDGSEDPIEISVKRASIDVPSIIYSTEDDGKIAHIRLLKFSGETVDEWNEIARDILKDPNIEGIILDLRNNPGGYLQASVDIASDFVDVGSVAVIEETSSGEKNEFRTERIGKLTNYKVVVLVNEGSASASEILAGALRDVAKTTLIGETTFGKGTIQEPIQINGGSGLHITTSRWLTPNGTWVNETGLEPDIQVEDNVDTTEDEQLQKAIEELNY